MRRPMPFSTALWFVLLALAPVLPLLAMAWHAPAPDAPRTVVCDHPTVERAVNPFNDTRITGCVLDGQPVIVELLD